ncbi:hypothetical protein [Kitasatospora cathayae]|uniref:DUF4254 domain-containing protein n=1 Tax=Kitasatospora cathayae TaxID=3004092 RepID=A0ABY7QEN2_9ACTN|nr:hypothetical protein [Kitasatospora sp. HUAS 3-15]WBP91218.1 hypothetical protein O1G21_38635 [Kitasatospora sp. HUAS 3-15]
MDIVYASLQRRQPAEPTEPCEVAEVLGALWAHATPADGLEHASGRSEADRVDLLLYLRTLDPTAADTRTELHRASDLLARCHQAAPVLRRRYLPPAGTVHPGPAA